MYEACNDGATLDIDSTEQQAGEYTFDFIVLPNNTNYSNQKERGVVGIRVKEQQTNHYCKKTSSDKNCTPIETSATASYSFVEKHTKSISFTKQLSRSAFTKTSVDIAAYKNSEIESSLFLRRQNHSRVLQSKSLIETVQTNLTTFTIRKSVSCSSLEDVCCQTARKDLKYYRTHQTLTDSRDKISKPHWLPSLQSPLQSWQFNYSDELLLNTLRVGMSFSDQICDNCLDSLVVSYDSTDKFQQEEEGCVNKENTESLQEKQTTPPTLKDAMNTVDACSQSLPYDPLYDVAFEFAKTHGYGFVEFVDDEGINSRSEEERLERLRLQKERRRKAAARRAKLSASLLHRRRARPLRGSFTGLKFGIPTCRGVCGGQPRDPEAFWATMAKLDEFMFPIASDNECDENITRDILENLSHEQDGLSSSEEDAKEGYDLKWHNLKRHRLSRSISPKRQVPEADLDVDESNIKQRSASQMPDSTEPWYIQAPSPPDQTCAALSAKRHQRQESPQKSWSFTDKEINTSDTNLSPRRSDSRKSKDSVTSSRSRTNCLTTSSSEQRSRQKNPGKSQRLMSRSRKGSISDKDSQDMCLTHPGEYKLFIRKMCDMISSGAIPVWSEQNDPESKCTHPKVPAASNDRQFGEQTIESETSMTAGDSNKEQGHLDVKNVDNGKEKEVKYKDATRNKINRNETNYKNPSNGDEGSFLPSMCQKTSKNYRRHNSLSALLLRESQISMKSPCEYVNYSTIQKGTLKAPLSFVKMNLNEGVLNEKHLDKTAPENTNMESDKLSDCQHCEEEEACVKEPPLEDNEGDTHSCLITNRCVRNCCGRNAPTKQVLPLSMLVSGHRIRMSNSRPGSCSNILPRLHRNTSLRKVRTRQSLSPQPRFTNKMHADQNPPGEISTLETKNSSMNLRSPATGDCGCDKVPFEQSTSKDVEINNEITNDRMVVKSFSPPHPQTKPPRVNSPRRKSKSPTKYNFKSPFVRAGDENQNKDNVLDVSTSSFDKDECVLFKSSAIRTDIDTNDSLFTEDNQESNLSSICQLNDNNNSHSDNKMEHTYFYLDDTVHYIPMCETFHETTDQSENENNCYNNNARPATDDSKDGGLPNVTSTNTRRKWQKPQGLPKFMERGPDHEHSHNPEHGDSIKLPALPISRRSGRACDGDGEVGLSPPKNNGENGNGGKSILTLPALGSGSFSSEANYSRCDGNSHKRGGSCTSSQRRGVSRNHPLNRSYVISRDNEDSERFSEENYIKLPSATPEWTVDHINNSQSANTNSCRLCQPQEKHSRPSPPRADRLELPSFQSQSTSVGRKHVYQPRPNVSVTSPEFAGHRRHDRVEGRATTVLNIAAERCSEFEHNGTWGGAGNSNNNSVDDTTSTDKGDNRYKDTEMLYLYNPYVHPKQAHAELRDTFTGDECRFKTSCAYLTKLGDKSNNASSKEQNIGEENERPTFSNNRLARRLQLLEDEILSIVQEQNRSSSYQSGLDNFSFRRYNLAQEHGERENCQQKYLSQTPLKSEGLIDTNNARSMSGPSGRDREHARRRNLHRSSPGIANTVSSEQEDTDKAEVNGTGVHQQDDCGAQQHISALRQAYKPTYIAKSHPETTQPGTMWGRMLSPNPKSRPLWSCTDQDKRTLFPPQNQNPYLVPNNNITLPNNVPYCPTTENYWQLASNPEAIRPSLREFQSMPTNSTDPQPMNDSMDAYDERSSRPQESDNHENEASVNLEGMDVTDMQTRHEVSNVQCCTHGFPNGNQCITGANNCETSSLAVFYRQLDTLWMRSQTEVSNQLEKLSNALNARIAQLQRFVEYHVSRAPKPDERTQVDEEALRNHRINQRYGRSIHLNEQSAMARGDTCSFSFDASRYKTQSNNPCIGDDARNNSKLTRAQVSDHGTDLSNVSSTFPTIQFEEVQTHSNDYIPDQNNPTEFQVIRPCQDSPKRPRILSKKSKFKSVRQWKDEVSSPRLQSCAMKKNSESCMCKQKHSRSCRRRRGMAGIGCNMCLLASGNKLQTKGRQMPRKNVRRTASSKIRGSKRKRENKKQAEPREQRSSGRLQCKSTNSNTRKSYRKMKTSISRRNLESCTLRQRPNLKASFINKQTSKTINTTKKSKYFGFKRANKRRNTDLSNRRVVAQRKRKQNNRKSNSNIRRNKSITKKGNLRTQITAGLVQRKSSNRLPLRKIPKNQKRTKRVSFKLPATRERMAVGQSKKPLRDKRSERRVASKRVNNNRPKRPTKSKMHLKRNSKCLLSSKGRNNPSKRAQPSNGLKRRKLRYSRECVSNNCTVQSPPTDITNNKTCHENYRRAMARLNSSKCVHNTPINENISQLGTNIAHRSQESMIVKSKRETRLFKRRGLLKSKRPCRKRITYKLTKVGYSSLLSNLKTKYKEICSELSTRQRHLKYKNRSNSSTSSLVRQFQNIIAECSMERLASLKRILDPQWGNWSDEPSSCPTIDYRQNTYNFTRSMGAHNVQHNNGSFLFTGERDPDFVHLLPPGPVHTNGHIHRTNYQCYESPPKLHAPDSYSNMISCETPRPCLPRCERVPNCFNHKSLSDSVAENAIPRQVDSIEIHRRRIVKQPADLSRNACCCDLRLSFYTNEQSCPIAVHPIVCRQFLPFHCMAGEISDDPCAGTCSNSNSEGVGPRFDSSSLTTSSYCLDNEMCMPETCNDYKQRLCFVQNCTNLGDNAVESNEVLYSAPFIERPVCYEELNGRPGNTLMETKPSYMVMKERHERHVDISPEPSKQEIFNNLQTLSVSDCERANALKRTINDVKIDPEHFCNSELNENGRNNDNDKDIQYDSQAVVVGTSKKTSHKLLTEDFDLQPAVKVSASCVHFIITNTELENQEEDWHDEKCIDLCNSRLSLTDKSKDSIKTSQSGADIKSVEVNNSNVSCVSVTFQNSTNEQIEREIRTCLSVECAGPSGINNSTSKISIKNQKYPSPSQILSEKFDELSEVDQKKSIKLEDTDIDTYDNYSLNINQASRPSSPQHTTHPTLVLRYRPGNNQQLGLSCELGDKIITCQTFSPISDSKPLNEENKANTANMDSKSHISTNPSCTKSSCETQNGVDTINNEMQHTTTNHTIDLDERNASEYIPTNIQPCLEVRCPCISTTWTSAPIGRDIATNTNLVKYMSFSDNMVSLPITVNSSNERFLQITQKYENDTKPNTTNKNFDEPGAYFRFGNIKEINASLSREEEKNENMQLDREDSSDRRSGSFSSNNKHIVIAPNVSSDSNVIGIYKEPRPGDAEDQTLTFLAYRQRKASDSQSDELSSSKTPSRENNNNAIQTQSSTGRPLNKCYVETVRPHCNELTKGNTQSHSIRGKFIAPCKSSDMSKTLSERKNKIPLDAEKVHQQQQLRQRLVTCTDEQTCSTCMVASTKQQGSCSYNDREFPSSAGRKRRSAHPLSETMAPPKKMPRLELQTKMTAAHRKIRLHRRAQWQFRREMEFLLSQNKLKMLRKRGILMQEVTKTSVPERHYYSSDADCESSS